MLILEDIVGEGEFNSKRISSQLCYYESQICQERIMEGNVCLKAHTIFVGEYLTGVMM